MTTGKMASVSVVIGAYNASNWIREAMDSALAQTYPVNEVLVMDDGSTDTTPDIVTSYGNIVKYRRVEHRGRPHRNLGIQAARGEYIAFLDADDYWHPKKLEEQMSLLLSTGSAWSICDAHWLDSATGTYADSIGLPLVEGDILEALFLNNFIVASTPVVARRVFDEVGLFDETEAVAAAEDWDLWLRIAARFPATCVRQRLATVRLHAGSFLAGQHASLRVRILEGVLDRAARREPVRLERLKPRAFANMYFAAGVRSFRQKDLVEARSYFVQALHRQPNSVAAIGYIVLTFLEPNFALALVQLKRRVLPPGVRPQI